MCAAGIMHRNIKPESVLVMADETIRLTDFGLAVDAKVRRHD